MKLIHHKDLRLIYQFSFKKSLWFVYLVKLTLKGWWWVGYSDFLKIIALAHLAWKIRSQRYTDTSRSFTGHIWEGTPYKCTPVFVPAIVKLQVFSKLLTETWLKYDFDVIGFCFDKWMVYFFSRYCELSDFHCSSGIFYCHQAVILICISTLTLVANHWNLKWKESTNRGNY